MRQTGAEVVTLRAGSIDEATLARVDPQLLFLSPGPGSPTDFNLSRTIELALARKLPIFGVCLGLQVRTGSDRTRPIRPLPLGGGRLCLPAVCILGTAHTHTYTHTHTHTHTTHTHTHTHTHTPLPTACPHVLAAFPFLAVPQGIVEHFGGKLGKLDYPMHGKPSEITLDRATDTHGIFAGVPDSFTAGVCLPPPPPSPPERTAASLRAPDTGRRPLAHRVLPASARCPNLLPADGLLPPGTAGRYHSLFGIRDPAIFPSCLKVTATTSDGCGL
eukprot:SAG22_NODE_249_length_13894_cov_60.455455_9_plen_274_part_00